MLDRYFELRKISAQITCGAFALTFAWLFLATDVPFAIVLMLASAVSGMVYSAIFTACMK